jgi:hypothetical protein
LGLNLVPLSACNFLALSPSFIILHWVFPSHCKLGGWEGDVGVVVFRKMCY